MRRSRVARTIESARLFSPLTNRASRTPLSALLGHFTTICAVPRRDRTRSISSGACGRPVRRAPLLSHRTGTLGPDCQRARLTEEEEDCVPKMFVHAPRGAFSTETCARVAAELTDLGI